MCKGQKSILQWKERHMREVLNMFKKITSEKQHLQS